MFRELCQNRLLLFTAIIFSLSLSACDKAEQEKFSGTLKTDNDSVYYQIDQYSGQFAFSEIIPYDTINNELEANLTLFTNSDTLVFPPDSTPRYVKVISGDSSTILTVTYFNMSRKALRDKVELLRQYANFSSAPTSLDFEFTYASPGDPDLTELKETYNLDSVAGHGGEISRVINLLNWANQIVRHDGSKDPADPRPRNALNIISTCKSENKGVNCRMMATLLNEAYLSTGFKSRHITCMPENKEDPDCHVINVVFSDSLNKWLYVDPTFAAYFMDADSNMLSIEEVRNKLIAGEKLLLPESINWNGAPYDKRAYGRYMAKNLFRFFCPLTSEFGYESKEKRTWVYLNPSAYDSDLTNTADTTETDKNLFIDYYIDDNNTFWAVP